MNKLITVTDALDFVANSGVAEWEFGGRASAEGFAKWLFDNRSEVNPYDYGAELRQYLLSVGEDPSDYGLA